jgi:tetratricopeptide (TPR) repeat protein
MRCLDLLALLVAGIALTACSQSGAPAVSSVSHAAAPAPVSAADQPLPSMQAPATLQAWERGAMLFDGLGSFHRPITTSSKDAQQYFDQGMRLLWGFNHDESARSFAHAALLDPQCAMCYWGLALTVGPNYNLPFMAQARAQVAFEAERSAKEKASAATPVDQALIDALSKRYPNAQALDPSNSAPVLAAYAQAMAGVAKRFPDDLDVQTLYAESLMNINAWKLWSADHRPAAGTLEITRILEAVLRRDPTHPGANHYYVHAMEASGHPEKALVSAQRLAGMMPAAGHMDHMPAHIMQLVGRYEEAAEANRKGAAADVAYFAKTTPPDYYAMYTAHNYQFLAYSAAMEGRRAETLQAVQDLRHTVPDSMLLAMPGFDWQIATRYAALVRFGVWDQLLSESAPDPRLLALTGGYLYGKGVAQAALGQVAAAEATLAQLRQLTDTLPAAAIAGFNSAKDVFRVAALMVQARIADAQGHADDAIALLRRAADAEDALAYDEPSDWFFPVRHVLGAQLLAAGQPAAAEAVYRTDLERNPHNGWSLHGLALALSAQHRNTEAATVERQFKLAWRHADVQPSASAY